MKPVGLSLDDIPALRVPIRFFLTAPLFGLAAAVFIGIEGETVFSTRWSVGCLAATHLVTLGFMAMVMIGALFQVVPVLGGGALPAARLIAPVVHLSLTAGVITLSMALYRFRPEYFAISGVLLAIAFLTFITSLGFRVLRRTRGGDAIFTIRLAAMCLVATVGMGFYFTLGWAKPELGLPVRSWTDLHASFGLGGWILLLIMGVSFQVIPMFHVTPAISTWLVRVLGLSIFSSLVLLSHAHSAIYVVPLTTLICVAAITYALATLRNLAQRRRKRPEPAVRAWQFALSTLIVASLLAWKLVCLPDVSIWIVSSQQESYLLAVLLIFGFGCTVILGMLQKILPFLMFMFLQRRCLKVMAAIPFLPSMNGIVTDRAAFWQVRTHMVVCAVIIAAVIWPELARLAALGLAVDFGICLANQVTALLRYRRVSLKITELEAEPSAVSP